MRLCKEGEVISRNPWRVAVGNVQLPATLSRQLQSTYIVLYPGRRILCIRREDHFHIVGVEATVKEYVRLRFPPTLWEAAETALRSHGGGDQQRYWYPMKSDLLGIVARAMFEKLGFHVVHVNLSEYGRWTPTALVSPLVQNQILVLDEVWAAVWRQGLHTKYFAVTPVTYEYGDLDEWAGEWEGAEILRTALWYTGVRRVFGEEPARERVSVQAWARGIKPELVPA